MKRLSIVGPFKVFCVIVIMHINWLKVFHTKSTMAEIDLCLLKLFSWINSVLPNSLYCYMHHHHTQDMMCFVPFCLMTENRILPPPLHTANESLNFLITHKLFFWDNYSLGEYIWLCGSLHMCHCIICIVIFSQYNNISIERGVIAPVHYIEVFIYTTPLTKLFFSI